MSFLMFMFFLQEVCGPLDFHQINVLAILVGSWEMTQRGTARLPVETTAHCYQPPLIGGEAHAKLIYKAATKGLTLNNKDKQN